MITTLGIDEAGRGAAVGPLVMYGVVSHLDIDAHLEEIGVDDSKKLTAEKRARLATVIKQHTYYTYQLRDAKTVDEYVAQKRLNVLEREMATNIIAKLAGIHHVDRIILDGTGIFEQISFHVKALNDIPRICEARADQNYMSVAAASICAKDHRDTVVREIMGEGFKGGAGYPNAATEKWINHLLWKASQETWFATEQGLNELCKHIRLSWKWKGLNKLKEKLSG